MRRFRTINLDEGVDAIICRPSKGKSCHVKSEKRINLKNTDRRMVRKLYRLAMSNSSNLAKSGGINNNKGRNGGDVVTVRISDLMQLRKTTLLAIEHNQMVNSQIKNLLK